MESERKVGGRRSPTTVSGPLAGNAPDFRRSLAAQGYARRTINVQMRMAAHLSRWLAAGDQTVEALRSADVIDRFFAERRAQGHGEAVSGKALAPLLGFLRDRHVIGPPVAEPATPAERLLAEYRTYLQEERGAAASTIRGFAACAAEFIRVLPAGRAEEAVAGLSAADVTTFVAGWAASRSPACSKSMVSALRRLAHTAHPVTLVPDQQQYMRSIEGLVPAIMPRFQAPRPWDPTVHRLPVLAWNAII
jgi:integrase/recombinase XerD